MAFVARFIVPLRPIHTPRILLPEHAPGSFCTCQYTRRSVFKFAQFAPGACSQIFNRLNIVGHFAGWKFCSRGWIIPMNLLVHTGSFAPGERAPGSCSGSKIPLVYWPLMLSVHFRKCYLFPQSRHRSYTRRFSKDGICSLNVVVNVCIWKKSCSTF